MASQTFIKALASVIVLLIILIAEPFYRKALFDLTIDDVPLM